jgi:hypothetical protein
MPAPSFTSVSIVWLREHATVSVSFTPHGDYSKKRPVVQLELAWAELSTDLRDATVQALLAAAEAVGDY